MQHSCSHSNAIRNHRFKTRIELRRQKHTQSSFKAQLRSATKDSMQPPTFLPFVTTSLLHHFPSSPLPFFTTSLHHHFPSSPLPFIITSLLHHSPSSSLPFFTTSLHHHFPSSPLPFIITSLLHHFPFSHTTLPHSQFFSDVLTHDVLLHRAPPFIIVNSFLMY